MLLRRTTLLSFLLGLFCFIISATKVFAETNADQATVDKLESFVRAGLDYVKQFGKQKAFAEIDNPKGKFREGELYLYVYNYEGICLAHGADPSLIGKNLSDYRDKYGTPVLKLVIGIAKKGGGFLTFYWPNPITKNLELKTGYILPIDDNTLIGSGVYKAIEVTKSQIVKIEEIKTFVNYGLEYLQTHGAERAYQEFNNPKSEFGRGELYLFVINYQGVVLAHGGDPKNQVGKNLINLRDEFNTPFVQLFIETAKSGGGLVTYYWPSPQSGTIQFKTSFIKPVGDGTLIGAGIYVDQSVS